jgi:hypothetical protein
MRYSWFLTVFLLALATAALVGSFKWGPLGFSRGI